MDWQCRQVTLGEGDVPEMMALQQEMLSALPSPRWYFPSAAEEFAQEARAGRVLGIRVDGCLAAFAIACPASLHPAECYAARVGRDEPRSLDFQDIMVAPAWRRQGIHAHFLRLYEQLARAQGLTAIYATVDPDNAPSFRSFEKAGYVRVAVQAAYDGRIRAYYRLGL